MCDVGQYVIPFDHWPVTGRARGHTGKIRRPILAGITHYYSIVEAIKWIKMILITTRNHQVPVMPVMPVLNHALPNLPCVGLTLANGTQMTLTPKARLPSQAAWKGKLTQVVYA